MGNFVNTKLLIAQQCFMLLLNTYYKTMFFIITLHYTFQFLQFTMSKE